MKKENIMIEIRYDGNLFLLPSNKKEAGVVTTNAIIRSNGRLVMGAGIAKYCRDTHKDIDLILGNHVACNGNKPCYAGEFHDRNRQHANPGQDKVNVISMPTKQNWRDPSDTNLIRESCRGLMLIADKEGFTHIYLPAPGCSHGGLDYVTQVREILLTELDDRFTVCLPTAIYSQCSK